MKCLHVFITHFCITSKHRNKDNATEEVPASSMLESMSAAVNEAAAWSASLTGSLCPFWRLTGFSNSVYPRPLFLPLDLGALSVILDDLLFRSFLALLLSDGRGPDSTFALSATALCSCWFCKFWTSATLGPTWFDQRYKSQFREAVGNVVMRFESDSLRIQ